MPSNTSFTSRYTPAEINTIAQNIMSIGHCTEQDNVTNVESHRSQSTASTSSGDVIPNEPVYKIYEKATAKSDKKRQIALFDAVEIDSESGSDSTDPSLSMALNAYKNSSHDCHELIIPIYNKKHNPRIYKLLHVEIMRQADTGDIIYSWSLYNPNDSVKALRIADNIQVNKIFTKVFGAFGTGEEVSLNQTQVNLVNKFNMTIQSAMCTLFNYISILHYKNVNKDFKLNANTANEFNKFLKLTHSNLEEAHDLVQNYNPQTTSSESENMSDDSDSPSVSPRNTDPRLTQSPNASEVSNNSSELSVNENAPLTLFIGNKSITLNPIKSENTVNEFGASIASNSSLELSTKDNQPLTLSVNGTICTLNPIADPFEIIKQWQKNIINTKDWGTKLGGNNVYYYYKTVSGEKDLTKESTYATVPDGVKLILDTIQTVQDHIFENKNSLLPEDIDELYAAAYCNIRKIAQDKLAHPGFNIGFFKTRSDITTNFYKAIVDDPNSKNIVSSAHQKLNLLLKK